MEDNSIWFWLNVVANLVQLESYNILVNDFNNHDLMKFLRHQDELLNKIIEQNNQLLQGGNIDARNQKNDTENS